MEVVAAVHMARREEGAKTTSPKLSVLNREHRSVEIYK